MTAHQELERRGKPFDPLEPLEPFDPLGEAFPDFFINARTRMPIRRWRILIPILVIGFIIAITSQ